MQISKVVSAILACSLSCSVNAASSNTNDSLHLDWRNQSVSPLNDFYAYANGNWQQKNPIPDDHASWGSFNILGEKVQKEIHEILINASSDKQAKPDTLLQKIGDFYFSGMDVDAVNKAGITPLNDELSKISGMESKRSLLAEIAHLHQIGVDVLFGFGSMQDYKNSQLVIGALVQSGLGLPNRDYYLKKDKKFEKIRESYVAHIAKMLVLAGESLSDSKRQAQRIMHIETELAKASMSPIEQRDPRAVYHLKTLKELDDIMPNFAWASYFSLRAQKIDGAINCAMPNFFKSVNELLDSVALEDWKAYFRWHLIDEFASYLSTPFVDENFAMLSHLTGVHKLQPRWKRVVNTESGLLGFAIGKIYVEKYFPESSKQEALGILKNIKEALNGSLDTLTWMSPKTKQAAIKKLALMQGRIGYPDKWRDYSNLKIDRGPYVLNVMRGNTFLINYDLNKIGKPVDKDEWAMTPQTINAYYDPSMNNLNIPAGILQSPFFDPHAPAAVNYGSIGFVIGHEITHGFDDQGSQFDEQGNLNNWWTPNDLTQFKQATECIEKQFSAYEVDGGLHVQGKLVVGEATADLGGIALAYQAFHNSNAYKEAKTIDGFTPDQQFFLGVAHVWAMNVRPEQLRTQVTTDPHPPAKYRVNGSLANLDSFYKAFHISSKAPMMSQVQCKIW